MGIELPQELVGVAQVAGVHWPQADEDKMRAAAQAWRDASTKLDTLVTDSDKTARSTLTHMQGGAGESATKHWSTFVQPDTGHLTATAKGCTAAADRLEHAADQVGVAKTEIVRQLVALAGNTDAAHTAAQSGHPTALAGLDTFVKGTAANVATINHSLVDAVRPGSGVDVSAVQPPAHAGPGEHGVVNSLLGANGTVPSLTGGVTNLVAGTTHGATGLVDPGAGQSHGLVANLTQGATNLVAGTTHGATGLVDGTVQGATNVVAGTTQDATGLVDPSQGHGHGLVGDTVQGATNLVAGTTQDATGLVDPGHGHGLVDGTVQGATNLVDNTAQGATGLVDPGHGHGHGLVGDTVQDATNLVDPSQGHGHGVLGDGPVSDAVHGTTDLIDHATAGDITAGDTGPIPAQHPDAPTPPTGLHHPVNQVVAAAGLADAPPAANLPGPAAGAFPAGPQPGIGGGSVGGGPIAGGGFVGGAPAGAAPIGGPFGGGQAGAGRGPVAGPFGGAPSAPGGGPESGRAGAGRGPVAAPFGGAPSAPGGGPGGSPEGGRAGGGSQAGAGRGPVAAPFGSAPPAPGGPVGAGLGNTPGARNAGPLVGAQQPAADHFPPPAAPLPPGHKTEREQLVAIMLVHMFPIGHMPVAATEPARQLPTPPPEIDFAAGMRFEPDDHPESHLVGAATPPDRIPVVDPLTAEDELVQDLLAGRDSLGDLHERDWDRKFLVRPAGPQGDVEYAWPPGELYPEGGTAPGEPEVLDAGTVLDRFGGEHGRVFAAVETTFAQRSLPPSHVDLEYRRYRVVAPIPVWRSVSAAWFAQPGGGERYRTTRSVAELVALGHLEDVTREGTP